MNAYIAFQILILILSLPLNLDKQQGIKVAIAKTSIIETPPSNYQLISIQGYKVFVNKDALTHEETKKAIKILEEKLLELNGFMQQGQLKFLKSVPIWMEWEILPQGAMWYHKSGEWLIENGYSGKKERSVEINNIRNFLAWQQLNQPYMVLHELAHAYHHQVLSSNKDILDAYQQASKSKIYESVAFNMGGKRRAYALNSADEYFAELTEAYFGQNDYYPFEREQLQKFDPTGYETMKKYWD
jgi:hypothetical protein